MHKVVPALRAFRHLAGGITQWRRHAVVKPDVIAVQLPLPDAQPGTAQCQLQGVAGVMQSQQVAHTGTHDFDLEGFDDIVQRTQCQALSFRFAGFYRCQENHRQLCRCRVLFEALTDFEAVHFRHRYIQQDDVRLQLLRQCQCLPAGLYGFDFIFVDQCRREDFQIQR